MSARVSVGFVVDEERTLIVHPISEPSRKPFLPTNDTTCSVRIISHPSQDVSILELSILY